MAAPLSKDCSEIGHSAEVLDSFGQRMCKGSNDGVLQGVPTAEASEYFILFPSDDVKGL